MKKNDLIRSFDQIRPSEELIRSTIVKIDDHKRRKKSFGSMPSIAFGTRLVGALCSLALVFCIGFAVARQNPISPDMRTIGQLESTAPSGSAQLHTPSDLSLPNGWILISGDINNLHFDELTDSDRENEAIRRCKVNISADGLISKSNTISVDLDKTEACFDASVLFYSEDTMDRFFDQSTDKMILCLTPSENGEWIIVDFEPFEN